MQADIQACAEIVHKADPDRFAAVMASPVAMRDVLFPLHAFAVEVARAPWVTQEPMIAEMRLQWWRDALEEIASGATVRAHEVVTPLASVISAETAKMLDGFVELRRWDIYKDPFEDKAHFHDYLTQTGSNFYRAMAQALGQDDRAAGEFGLAAAIANWLVAVPELEARGRVPLLDGRPEGAKALAETGLAALHKSRSLGIAKPLRPAMLSGWKTERLLRQAYKNPQSVADGTLGLSDFSKKSSLMWKTLSGRV